MRKSYFLVLWISLAFLAHITRANARQSSVPLQMGYIRLLPASGTNSPAGVAIFGLQQNGVLISETGVPSTTTIQSGRIFAEIEGPINTGIALANPNDQDVTISYNFTDTFGRDFGAGSFTLQANHQIARFLNEQPFSLASSLLGTFTFRSSKPIATVALRSFVNQRSEVLITTVPVSPLGSGPKGTVLLIPRFGDVGSWTTEVALVNPYDTVLSGTVQFFGQAPKNRTTQPTKVLLNGVTSSTFTYTIPPRSAIRMLPRPARNSSEAVSVRITPGLSSSTPASLGIFSHQNNGVTVSTASVTALPTAKAFRMYIESAGVFGQIESIQTVLAIWNPSGARVTILLSAMKLDGTPTGLSTAVDIPAGGQIVKLGSDLFPQLPSPFKGVLKISAPSSIAVVGLRTRDNQRDDMLMTATPPYDEASPPILETDFPHFVSGAGYSTQLILLSTGTAQTGSLWLLSQEGVPMPSSTIQPNP